MIMKTLKQIQKEINPEEFYRPAQISKNQWLPGYQGKNAYAHILKLIQKRRIKAKNFGLGKTPYFRILGAELLKFINRLFR